MSERLTCRQCYERDIRLYGVEQAREMERLRRKIYSHTRLIEHGGHMQSVRVKPGNGGVSGPIPEATRPKNLKSLDTFL